MKEKDVQKRDERKNARRFLLVLFVLTIVAMGLGVWCLQGIKNPLVQSYLLLFSVLICLVFGGLCAASVWWAFSGREKIAKGALGVYILTVFSLTVCLILQKTGFFEVIKTPEKLREYLEKAGIWMPLFYIALQFLQVVILPIPSVISTVAGVALFGAFWAMLYSLAGILLGSITAFLIGRKLGNRAVSWIVGEDTLQKWQKKLKGKDNLFLTAMFILPVFPDDILCFVAGLSSMSVGYFLTVIFISRAIGIAATCYSVRFIPINTWWGILLWVIIVAVILVLFIALYKNLDKLQGRNKTKPDEGKNI